MDDGIDVGRNRRLPSHILLSLALVAATVVGATLILADSTWTYSWRRVDAATTDRLARLQSDLVVAGAPESAVRAVGAAARPGIVVGDAIEAVADADKALRSTSNAASVAILHEELLRVYKDLYGKEYWAPPTPATRDILLPMP